MGDDYANVFRSKGILGVVKVRFVRAATVDCRSICSGGQAVIVRDTSAASVGIDLAVVEVTATLLSGRIKHDPLRDVYRIDRKAIFSRKDLCLICDACNALTNDDAVASSGGFVRRLNVLLWSGVRLFLVFRDGFLDNVSRVKGSRGVLNAAGGKVISVRVYGNARAFFALGDGARSGRTFAYNVLGKASRHNVILLRRDGDLHVYVGHEDLHRRDRDERNGGPRLVIPACPDRR